MAAYDGKTVYARAQVPQITTGWAKYTVLLRTFYAPFTDDARFVISTGSAGTFWLNQVSLFRPTYRNRPNGNRIDLMEEMAAMKPHFLRMPGGNYLEGNTIETRFEWKNTIGPIEQRPGHMGTWGYRSDEGLGLLEFLEWCEDLNMQPLLAVYAGYSLNGTHVNPGPDLSPTCTTCRTRSTRSSTLPVAPVPPGAPGARLTATRRLFRLSTWRVPKWGQVRVPNGDRSVSGAPAQYRVEDFIGPAIT